jgi:hypothetical protein
MTAAAVRSTANFNLPHTQNTAPVHEFRCMFTHDLRRKQKRWQDGLLKFHTFNKRVMVYDDVRNFIGDTHWKEDGALQMDDEITLDEGILVQLGEAVRTIQTDLTPLFERERKRPEEGAHKAAPELSTAARRTLGGQTNGIQVLQKKHKSLNTLLGAPRGGHGRAVLPQSPYDARHGVDENRESPSMKRRKVGEDQTSAQSWSVTRLTKATPSKEMPLWTKTSGARRGAIQLQSVSKAKKDPAPKSQRRLMVKEIVDITSDHEEFESDVTMPSTPSSVVRFGTKMAVASVRPATEPVIEPPIVPARRNRSPELLLPPLSPSVSTTNRVQNIQSRLDAEADASPVIPEAAPKLKALRLAKSQPRPMLLCQKPVSKGLESASAARGVFQDLLEFSDVEELPAPKPASKRVGRKPTLIENGASVALIQEGVTAKAIRNVRDSSSPAFTNMGPRAEHFEAPCPSPNKPIASEPRIRKQKTMSRLDELALAQGMMDQRLMSASSKASKQRSKPTNQAKAADGGLSKAPSDRVFRRVQSESDANMPAMLDEDLALLPIINEEDPAPSVATKSKSRSKSPAKRAPQSKASTTTNTKKKSQQAKQPLQRSMSLNQVIQKTRPKQKQMEEPLLPVKDVEVGPWTVEATDLFDWRPPDWEERIKTKAQAMEG